MTMGEVDVFKNEGRILYDMERYGVDMCVIMPAFSMTDEINAELVKQYPNKFIAQVGATDYVMKVKQGKEKWSIPKLCEELDRLLSTGLYRAGIGESIPYPMGDNQYMRKYEWKERFEEICQIMEVAQKHKVAVCYHTGMLPSGYLGGTLFFGLPQHEFA